MTIMFSLLVLAFFLAGISLNSANIAHVVSFTALSWGFFKILKDKVQIKIPPNFIWIIIWILILQINLIFTKEKVMPFYFFLTFLEGAGFWLVFFNLKENLSIKMSRTVIAILLIYSLFYFVSKFFNLNLVQYMDYFYRFAPGPIHQHLGDFWAIGMILIGMQNLPILTLGTFFLVISHSRSAFLALFAGLTHLLYIKGWKVNKKIFYLLLLIGIGLFIYTGFYKTILFSRPYYLQSLLGVIHFPLGAGMGNFTLISSFIGERYQFLYWPSTYSLNIVLEALSGAGVLFVPFLIWIVLTIKNVLKLKNKWAGVFLAVTVNFLFDYSYIIPGLIWIWFISLALAQKEG